MAATPGGPRTGVGIWRAVERPVRLLIWLLIALCVVEIYLTAEFLVVHIFNVVLLFVFASILALLLTPVVDRMERVGPFRGRRGLAALVVWAVIIGVIAGGITLVIPSIVEQAQQLPSLSKRVQSIADGLQRNLSARGIPFDLHNLTSGSGTLFGSALSVIAGTVTVVIDLLLVIVISIYLLIQGRELLAAIRKLFPDHTHYFDFTLVAVGTTIGSYVRGQLIMSLLMGAYTGISLTILGVHYAVLLGILAALLEFLPLVGATISMAIIILVALLQSPTLAILAAAVGLGGHALDAYIVGPRVNARAVQLHPLAAMAALLVGAELGGILGALFAVPVAAILNIFLGAFYRARKGDEPLSTHEEGVIAADALPRLGEEISEVHDDDEVIVDEPVPHTERREEALPETTPRERPAAATAAGAGRPDAA